MSTDKLLLQIDALCSEMHELNAILDTEFEAIKRQEMDRLEGIQKEKESILTPLSDGRFQALVMAIENSGEADDSSATLLDKWENLRHITIASRDKLKRNEVLIQRKLTVLRDAVQTLYHTDNGKSLLLYNRLGKLSRGNGSL
jgi:flagellar biosynthesis/type III secretory pathway chaperone